MHIDQFELRPSNYNYDVSRFLSRVQYLLSRDEHLLGSVVQRSIIIKPVGGEAQHGVTRFDVLPHPEDAGSNETVDYEALTYVREVISKETLLTRLSGLSDGKLEVAGQPFAATGLGFHDQYEPSSRCSWPTRLFDISFGSVQLTYEPLLHPTLKSFATPFDAICEFLGFENFSGSSDGRLGHILLYIPNLNARLAQLRLKDNLLHVVVDGSAKPESLKLDLAYKNKGETASITKRLQTPEETLELSFRPTELHLWLISAQGFIGDFHDENEHYSKGANALLPKKKQSSFVDMEFDDDQLSHIDADVHPRRVFVIHGHDTSYRESVARFLEKLGLEPVILHEQPNLGSTIIEKFETHSEVAFALALLTADDEARVVNDTMPLRPRARQNVIFEFGYFIGKLGRRHVCALREKDVEIPSDYHGVVYIALDDSGHWKLELVRELKAAGLAVDANRAVE